MITASEEQRVIIDSVKSGNNVIVDSVAGSGKTTLIQFIASEMSNKNILVFTYNRRLMDESNARFVELPNVRVFTYHSFVSRNYCAAKDDVGINQALHMPPKKPFSKIDILILDEAQDITPIYYKLITKILSDLPIIPQMCIIGDRYQSIYEYNGADQRFLTHSDKVFEMTKLPWVRTNMHCSYRVTEVMANFINRGVLGIDRIVAYKKGGAKIKHYTMDVFKSESIYHEIFKPLLLEYSHSDIFVLMASIKTKSTSPTNKLANYLSIKGIPIGFTSDKGHAGLMNNKLIFSSFHQSKGLESKVVIVFGFDESYFEFYARGDDKTQCNNPLYVALTRAKERLILISGTKNNPFAFLKKVSDLCDYHGIAIKSEKIDKIRTRSVTNMIDKLDVICTKAIVDEFIPYSVISAPEESIMLPYVVENKYNGLESVSNINGIALPIWAAYKTIGSKVLIDILDDNLNTADKNGLLNSLLMVYSGNAAKKNIDAARIAFYNFARRTDIKLSEMLQFATGLDMYKTNLNYRVNQILHYEWLDDEIANLAIARYSKIITHKSKFEISMLCAYSLDEKKDELNGETIIGVADCIDGDTMWEFKACKENEPKHLLQLAMYAYLNMATNKAPQVQKYKLFNVVDNYVAEIHVTKKQLCSMMDKIMTILTSINNKPVDDSAFFRNVKYYNKELHGKVVFYCVYENAIIYKVRGREKITKAGTSAAKLTFVEYACGAAMLIAFTDMVSDELLEQNPPTMHIQADEIIKALQLKTKK